MEKYIAILRGINVGGKRKILMADLKTLLGTHSFKNVQTYIQSGNVVFDFIKETSELELSELIEELILQKYGFDEFQIEIRPIKVENTIVVY